MPKSKSRSGTGAALPSPLGQVHVVDAHLRGERLPFLPGARRRPCRPRRTSRHRPRRRHWRAALGLRRRARRATAGSTVSAVSARRAAVTGAEGRASRRDGRPGAGRGNRTRRPAYRGSPRGPPRAPTLRRIGHWVRAPSRRAARPTTRAAGAGDGRGCAARRDTGGLALTRVSRRVGRGHQPSRGGRRSGLPFQAQQLFDAADHSGWLKWFLEYSAGAARRHARRIHRFKRAGQEQHRHVLQGRLAPHEAGDLVAVHPGHRRPGQHDVRPLGRDAVDRLLPVRHRDDAEVLVRERQGDHALNRDALVSEQKGAHEPGYSLTTIGRPAAPSTGRVRPATPARARWP